MKFIVALVAAAVFGLIGTWWQPVAFGGLAWVIALVGALIVTWALTVNSRELFWTAVIVIVISAVLIALANQTWAANLLAVGFALAAAYLGQAAHHRRLMPL